MTSRFSKKSPVDSIIVDMILDHYNMQSMRKKKETLSGESFQMICDEAREIYLQQIMISETPGVA